MNQDIQNNTTCSNCNEQDTITIAGKNFCANCGTPQAAATAQATAPSSNTVVTPSLSTVAHVANQESENASPSASEKMPTQVSPKTVDAPQEQPAVTTTAPLPQPIGLQNQADTPLSTPSSPAISRYSDAPTQGDQVQETIGGSEIISLDDKSGESVMSDETLDELAKTSSEPASTTESTEDSGPVVSSSYKLDLTQTQAGALPKAVSDIRPATQPKPQPAVAAAPAQTVSSTPTVPLAPATQPPAAVPTVSSTSNSAGLTPPVPQNIAQPSSPQPAVASVIEQTAAVTAQTPAKASGFKAGSVALSLVGILMIGAYVWQVNYPNLALKMAGSKAGISANFPGYVPSGWKLTGNIESSPGNISYRLADANTDKALQVSESKTSWDSQALAENYVAPKSDNYLALQSQGLTIYIYDGNQASWVNNGTWYRLEGENHGLSQDQIIKLATSL